MRKKRLFIRNMEAGDHLEVFLVSAVAAVLIIRGYLHFTGYPQLGDNSLHIAHTLWGGLIMLASIFILISFLSKAAESVAVVVAGIGFGTFIDEVGKFVTMDNDYFFKPSVAIIYVIFILIFLVIRAVQTRGRYSEVEYLMNAIRDLEEIAFRDLNADEKNRILDYLSRSDPTSPLVTSLRQALDGVELTPNPPPGPIRRARDKFCTHYRQISSYRWFDAAMISFFIFQTVGSLAYVAIVVLPGNRSMAWTEWAQLASSSFSAILVIWGAVIWRASRLEALRLFERSILVSIFLTQVFVFYQEQLGGLIGLVVDLAVLISLRFMISREQDDPVCQITA